VVLWCDHQLTGGAGSTSASGEKASEESTRSALIAWLGSEYVDHDEMESRLAVLARDISDNLNSKIDSAAMLAAAAAGLITPLIRWTCQWLYSFWVVTNMKSDI